MKAKGSELQKLRSKARDLLNDVYDLADDIDAANPGDDIFHREERDRDLTDARAMLNDIVVDLKTVRQKLN